MQIVIDISEKEYAQICERHGRLSSFVRSGKVLPKGHGLLIDADAFIDGLRDSSKRQRYNECLIDEFLTVDDVFQAVIESLENKGLAEGDAPTIIEADKEANE